MKPILPPGDFGNPPDSEEKITLLDFERFVETQTRKKIAHEIEIACEIYLARHWSCIHYADLMDDVPPDTASKTMLLSWLNDRIVRGKLVRPGLVSLYRKERPDHFPGGAWNANRYCQYIEYVAKRLTDRSFVGKEKAVLFRNSFRNTGWLAKAAPVCGLKLLEDCHRQGTLKSSMARDHLEIAFNERARLEDTAKIIGRCIKNGDAPEELGREIRRITEKSIKQGFEKRLSIHLNHEEDRLYEKWKPSIEAALSAVPTSIETALRLPDPSVTGLLLGEGTLF